MSCNPICPGRVAEGSLLVELIIQKSKEVVSILKRHHSECLPLGYVISFRLSRDDALSTSDWKELVMQILQGFSNVRHSQNVV